MNMHIRRAAPVAALAGLLALLPAAAAHAAEDLEELRPGKSSGLAYFYAMDADIWFSVLPEPDARACNAFRNLDAEHYAEMKLSSRSPSPCFEVDVEVERAGSDDPQEQPRDLLQRWAQLAAASGDPLDQPHDAIRGWAVTALGTASFPTKPRIFGATSSAACRALVKAGASAAACRAVVIKISPRLSSNTWIYFQPVGLHVMLVSTRSDRECQAQRRNAIDSARRRRLGDKTEAKTSVQFAPASPCLPVKFEKGHGGTAMRAWITEVVAGVYMGGLSREACEMTPSRSPCAAVSVSRP
jgi:hypothetical protein